MIISLLTERSARKHVTETRRRTPPAVFRPDLQNMKSHERGNREELMRRNSVNLRMEPDDNRAAKMT